MNNIFLTYSALVTPLGADVESNFREMLAGKSGIQCFEKSGIQQEDLFLSLFSKQPEYSYDRLIEQAIIQAEKDFPEIDLSSSKTGFIVSSTKGNLADLHLDIFASTRRIIAQKTENKKPVTILSNACISGVSAINTAANAIRSNIYDHVLVIGIDLIWDFVKYGFQCLYAMSPAPVKPYDSDRKGVNLGEAMATILVSNKTMKTHSCQYLGGANANDANHISGPSRTGEGLVRAITQTMERSGVSSDRIDFISAHGTGTLFNDEMESIAFSRLNLAQKPLHSLKGYFGHTLGAAGVLETVILLYMMQQQTLIPCKGFTESGTSVPLNIVQEANQKSLSTVLKTASGFGGGNASLIFQKIK